MQTPLSYSLRKSAGILQTTRVPVFAFSPFSTQKNVLQPENRAKGRQNVIFSPAIRESPRGNPPGGEEPGRVSLRRLDGTPKRRIWKWLKAIKPNKQKNDRFTAPDATGWATPITVSAGFSTSRRTQTAGDRPWPRPTFHLGCLYYSTQFPTWEDRLCD